MAWKQLRVPYCPRHAASTGMSRLRAPGRIRQRGVAVKPRQQLLLVANHVPRSCRYRTRLGSSRRQLNVRVRTQAAGRHAIASVPMRMSVAGRRLVGLSPVPTALRVHRVGRIERFAQLGRTVPFVADRAGAVMQFLGNRVERQQVCARAANRSPAALPEPHGWSGLQAQGFLENAFRLLFASISHVDIGLGHRVDLVGIELRGGRDEA